MKQDLRAVMIYLTEQQISFLDDRSINKSRFFRRMMSRVMKNKDTNID